MKIFKRALPQVVYDVISDMEFSDAGMCGLPIEIWERIFRLATSSVVFPVDFYHEFQTNIPTSSLLPCHSRSILTDFIQTQQPAIFQMRRSIVLVCKAWYFMGIEALHSHVRLTLYAPYEPFFNFRRALDCNPRFASSIVRLSIVALPGFGYSDIDWVKGLRRALNEVLSRLTQLKIISCPYFLSDWQKMARYPEMCITYCNPFVSCWNTYERITKVPCFWRQAHTLVIGMKGEAYKLRKSPPITCPNLINLSLWVERVSTLRWITTLWRIPNLRSLTLSSTVGIGSEFLRFVAKSADSLEYLELVFGEVGYPDEEDRNLEKSKNHVTTKAQILMP